MHGWTYWYAKSNEYEKEVYEIQAAYEHEYGRSKATDIMLTEDAGYQNAIQNQQLAERRVNTFGHAVTIRLLEALMAEIRNPR